MLKKYTNHQVMLIFFRKVLKEMKTPQTKPPRNNLLSSMGITGPNDDQFILPFRTENGIPYIPGSAFTGFHITKIPTTPANQPVKNSRSDETNRKLFNMIISWVEHEPENRSIYLPNLLELIPFKELSKDFLKTDAANRSLIRQSHSCCIQIIDALIKK